MQKSGGAPVTEKCNQLEGLKRSTIKCGGARLEEFRGLSGGIIDDFISSNCVKIRPCVEFSLAEGRGLEGLHMVPSDRASD